MRALAVLVIVLVLSSAIAASSSSLRESEVKQAIHDAEMIEAATHNKARADDSTVDDTVKEDSLSDDSESSEDGTSAYEGIAKKVPGIDSPVVASGEYRTNQGNTAADLASAATGSRSTVGMSMSKKEVTIALATLDHSCKEKCIPCSGDGVPMGEVSADAVINHYKNCVNWCGTLCDEACKPNDDGSNNRALCNGCVDGCTQFCPQMVNEAHRLNERMVSMLSLLETSSEVESSSVAPKLHSDEEMIKFAEAFNKKQYQTLKEVASPVLKYAKRNGLLKGIRELDLSELSSATISKDDDVDANSATNKVMQAEVASGQPREKSNRDAEGTGADRANSGSVFDETKYSPGGKVEHPAEIEGEREKKKEEGKMVTPEIEPPQKSAEEKHDYVAAEVVDSGALTKKKEEDKAPKHETKAEIVGKKKKKKHGGTRLVTPKIVPKKKKGKKHDYVHPKIVEHKDDDGGESGPVKLPPPEKKPSGEKPRVNEFDVQQNVSCNSDNQACQTVCEFKVAKRQRYCAEDCAKDCRKNCDGDDSCEQCGSECAQKCFMK